ncbi:methyltransferase, partial [Microbacterium sp. SUBG005]
SKVAAPLQSTRTYEWNRGLGEIVTALLSHGLRIDTLVEHDSVPWEALPGRMTLRADGEYALTEQPSVMPLSYTIRATKVA